MKNGCGCLVLIIIAGAGIFQLLPIWAIVLIVFGLIIG